jgi:hypothetical protein
MAFPDVRSQTRACAATGAVPSWNVTSGNATCGKIRMTANNANSKIRIENCQRFMGTQLVLSQELLFPAPAVNREPPPGGGVVGGWSRPSSLHTSAVSHWALAAEVPQGLKPHRNTAFNAALKRYSTQLKFAQESKSASDSEGFYFTLPGLGSTTTREVTCCPFSIPPTITNPSGRTSNPR